MVVRHGGGALRLRLWPGALAQLRRLLDQHSFWGQGRSAAQLRQMLAASQAGVRRVTQLLQGFSTEQATLRLMLRGVSPALLR